MTTDPNQELDPSTFDPLLTYLTRLQATTDAMNAQPVTPPTPAEAFSRFLTNQLENRTRSFTIGGDNQ